jgi:hypothetical protein
MAVREHDALDLAEIGVETRHVAFGGVFLRAGIEQNGVARLAAPGGDQA